MLIRTYVPQMPLAMFVDYFWYMEDYNPAHAKEQSLPDGSVDVVIDLREDRIRLFDKENRELLQGHSILCGPHTDFFVIDTEASASRVIGIHFKPGGVHAFLRQPVHEILNTHLSLSDLWGSSVSDLRDELLGCGEPEDMFQVLEKSLISQATVELYPHPAVQFVLGRLSHCQLSGLIDQLGMSHRTFIQLFKKEVGMSPKRMSRIFRFQDALSNIRNGSDVSWTEVALTCGYYDQAHFIKEFQAFSGINPTEYRAIPGRHANHAAFTV